MSEKPKKRDQAATETKTGVVGRLKFLAEPGLQAVSGVFTLAATMILLLFSLGLFSSPAEPVTELPDVVSPSDKALDARFDWPAKGSVVRGYEKGQNEGIDIALGDASLVVASADGEVAAITSDVTGNPIVVLRHPDGLLTVYANLTSVDVEKNQQVRRGQKLGQIISDEERFLHFEVRDGFEAIDPLPYLPI